MIPTFTGQIVEWNAAKGCGWIETDGQRIFLHERVFLQGRQRPKVRHTVRFTAGLGPTRLTCARQVIYLNGGTCLGYLAFFTLSSLLVLPGLALIRLHVDLRIASACALAVSVAAYVVNAHDKRQAQTQGWRVSEAKLHFLELLGGWPGAFVAQRSLRHKNRKLSYQIVFWFVVLGYQIAAFDILQDWRLTRAVYASFVA